MHHAQRVVAYRAMQSIIRGMGIDFSDRQVPMRLDQFPAMILLALERSVIGKQLPRHDRFLRGRQLILVHYEHAVVPALVFAGVQPRSIDGVLQNTSRLFLAIEYLDLIPLENVEELVGVSPLDSIHPLDQMCANRSGTIAPGPIAIAI